MTQWGTATTVATSVVAGSRPYPWPWDGRIDPASLGLLVIQAPGPSPRPDPAIETIGMLAGGLERRGATVIQLTTQAPPRQGRDPVALRESTPPIFDASATAAWIESPGWNGFFDSPLDVELRRRGITHLLVTGYWLEIGVHSTMRAGNDMGYECLLIEDAVVAADPLLTPASLSSIEMSGGIFGAVGSASAVLDAIPLPPLSTETKQP